MPIRSSGSRTASGSSSSRPTAPSKETRVPAGTTLFDAASWNGVAIDSTCGGHGTCKKCKVRVASGSVPISPVDPRAFTPDELKAGLAARLPRRGAQEDLVVEVPPLQTRPKAALVGVGRHVILRPGRAEALPRADRADARGPDLRSRARPRRRWTTSSCASRSTSCAPSAARCASPTGRSRPCSATTVLIDVEPGDTTARRFALAFDLGTTTVVANLLDLETGQPAAVRSMLNKQQPFGADVITRISATMIDPAALGMLRTARARDARRAHRRGVRGGRRRSARGLRDRRRRQHDDDPARARDRPRAALDGAVHDRGARRLPAATATDFGVRRAPARPPSCSRRSARTSAPTSSPASWRPA